VIIAVVLAAVAAWLIVGSPLPEWWTAEDPEARVTDVGGSPPPPPVSGPVAVVVQGREQAPSGAAAPTGETPAAAGATGPKVDESALRYFARQGDRRRLEAEIARLRALYPGWQPPADPAAPPDHTDAALDRMWQLFAEGNYAGVRSAIAERRAAEPGWAPPAALTELLDQADARTRLTNASDAKQWKTVLDIAAATPSLLTCDNVDILWRVAEAFANTERAGRARDAYVYILSNCDDPAERLATVEKAIDLLTEGDVEALLGFERGEEFRPARDILTRRRVGAVAENPDAAASPEDIARLEALAADSGDAADALLLGWYYYRHKEPAKALDWFGKARLRDPDSAKAAEGYVLSLIALGRFAEAETAGHDWIDKSPDNLAAYLIAVVDLLATDPPVKVSEAVLERIVAVTLRERNVKAGEQLGWYAYNLGQVKTAARWFETVRKWDPDYEPAAYGLAVARWALKDRAGVNAIIREWRDRSERIANIGKPVKAELRGSVPVVDVIVGSVRAGDARPAALLAYAGVEEEPNGFDPGAAVIEGGGSPVVRGPAAIGVGGTAGVGPRCADGPPVTALSPQSALVRGWCLMDLNRPAEAAIAFDIALTSTNPGTREDAAYGASLARLRTGVTSQASVSAAAAPQDAGRRTELTAAILAQQATAAFADGRYVEAILALDERLRYAPEQTDLLLLRGFAYFKFGRYPEAKRIFEAVARTGVPEAINGLAAVQAAQSGLR
jgi:tetratricopeptide (TPR) repeat protein